MQIARQAGMMPSRGQVLARRAAGIHATGREVGIDLNKIKEPSDLPGIYIRKGKTWDQVEAQMNRILEKRARRLGLTVPGDEQAFQPIIRNSKVERVHERYFEFSRLQESGNVAGAHIPASGEWCSMDIGVLAPRAIGGREFGALSLRSRIDVMIAHEMTELPSYLARGDVALTHPFAVRFAWQTTLPITPQARSFLRGWANRGPYSVGLP
jgi:hypothetical protein